MDTFTLSENNNRKTFLCDVTSGQSSLISTERSAQVQTAMFDGLMEEIMVNCASYDCLMVIGKPKAFPSSNFKQITKEGSKP